ncbi:MAG: adenylosuccinate lyase [Nitrososphaerota archaeon]|nr:adenylosuccinate lyase [Nitrososphaerota archaeon]
MSSDALSPVDGRYSKEVEPLRDYFSERALVAKRVDVELRYLALLKTLGIAPDARIPRIELSMSRVKKLEEEMGHDVKAVEVFIRRSLDRSGASPLAPYVHLGLTSEDTNSIAYAILLRDALRDVILPEYSRLATALAGLAKREAKTAMLARTHGRPAVPTTFGKEVAVFAVRLAERTSLLKSKKPTAKLSGAVGTYASFKLMKDLDWPRVFRGFVEKLGLDYAAYTTQVVPGEGLSDVLHLVINTNQLMRSLARDLWLYQTLDYVCFTRPGKVSSSTMPQKENPVDLENAEGQTEISDSILTLLAYRLQTTRMQRDLSDSVLRRMVGQGLAHSLVACRRLEGSLRLMVVDRKAMADDLSRHREVYAEAAQVAMRLKGDERGYEKVRSAVAGGRSGSLSRYAGGPDGYVGLAPKLALDCARVVSKLLASKS